MQSSVCARQQCLCWLHLRIIAPCTSTTCTTLSFTNVLQISSRLSKVRDEAGDLCMQQVQPHNSALVMAQCGSKGSPINIAQMMALVGQQTVGGRRIPNGFQERTLPHFPRGWLLVV